jgi:UDP-N-acetylglucosamine acyltransferase
MSVKIDPRAEVHPKAELGIGVTVGPFAVVEAGAVIGEGTAIASHAYVASGARIGRECVIHYGSVIGHAPQDLTYAGEPSTCEIGDRTIVREFATLHRGTGNTGRTLIGSDNLIMGYVHIAHDCIIGSHVILANAVMIAGHGEIQDYAVVGGMTPIHQFVRIGRHCMVGGGYRVSKDIPPFILAGQEPLVYEGLNIVGLRRRNFPPAVIQALERSYTLIYRSALNVSQAVTKIREDASLMSVAEVQQVVSFIELSKRGIIAGHRHPR